VRRLDYPNFDVLVVDSAPRSHPARETARRWGARYIFEPVPGVSRARNCGARASDAEFVAILDDEAIADPGWRAGLAREFSDPQVMAIAGRIKDFEPHSHEERVCAALSSADCGEERRAVDRTTPLWFERACFGGIGNGGNLAFRREVFDVWPGFCESLGAGSRIIGGEEHYAFFTLIDLGFRVVYSPQAVVSHPCPRTTAELKARHYRYLSASIGYIALLFFEQPRWRGRILKYLAEAARGVPRPWRGSSSPSGMRINSRWRTAQAVAEGLARYALVRLTAGPRPQPQGVAPNPAAQTERSASIVYLDRKPEGARAAKNLRVK